VVGVGVNIAGLTVPSESLREGRRVLLRRIDPQFVKTLRQLGHNAPRHEAVPALRVKHLVPRREQDLRSNHTVKWQNFLAFSHEKRGDCVVKFIEMHLRRRVARRPRFQACPELVSERGVEGPELGLPTNLHPREQPPMHRNGITPRIPLVHLQGIRNTPLK